MKTIKAWLGAGAVVAGMALAGSARADEAAPLPVGQAPAGQPAGDDGLKVGQQALMFQAKVLNPDQAGTKVVDLQAMTTGGKKAVVLSFFATYCEPCKKELPFLEKMHAKYREQGLQVIVVNIDTKPEEIAKVADLVKENSITYPIASDRFNIVAKRYGVKRLPCLYLLDAAGKVALASTGYTEEFGGQLLAAVQGQLGVPADPQAVPHAGPASAPAPAAAPAVAVASPAEEPANAPEDKGGKGGKGGKKGKAAKGKKKGK